MNTRRKYVGPRLTEVTEVWIQGAGADITLRPEDVDPQDAMTLSWDSDGTAQLDLG